MLDKDSEKLLKIALCRYTGNIENAICIFPKDIGIHYTELNALCKKLFDFEYLINYCSTIYDNQPVEIYLTHKALKYFEIKKAEKISTFKKSILVPIIVTLLTQLLVFLLKQLLPLILKLLHSSP